jgi:hypothetical protein
MIFLTGCSPLAVPPEPTSARSFTTEAAVLPTRVDPTATLTLTSITTSTASPTLSPSETPTLTSSPTATATAIPTYQVLRGKVNQEHVSCFYGPSKAYLYKYGLVGGSHLEIIGSMPDTGYIEIRAIGGTNPCWMNLQFMDVEGDINTVQPIDPLSIVLPRSPYYSGLTWSKADRSGNEVTVTWDYFELRAGDDSEQEPYLLEAWVCQAGKIIFVPLGLYDNTATLTDEAGCDAPSHGRVYVVEKHGYTHYLEIDWPPAAVSNP